MARGFLCRVQCTIRFALIFLFPRFSASNEPMGFDGKLWSARDGGGEGGEGWSNDESALISNWQMLAGMYS